MTGEKVPFVAAWHCRFALETSVEALANFPNMP
jgi:hypothetical protein